ncbi:MAG TPA: ABC transporter ATP-binding protein [Actinomycetota bacterium]|jgi:putative ABC transport system ATP-binding protein
MTALVEWDDVTKVFGSGHVQVDALSHVSLQALRGELVAVMGPSGSGKSTMLSVAGGLDRPTSGRVVVDGEDLSTMGAAELALVRRRRVGYVFQQLNLIDGLTAEENISLPLELDGMSGRRARSAARTTLALVEMRDLAGRFPEELSGGEQQRVAIARAVVGDRALLLADEPTGALDSSTGEAVLRLLRAQCDRGACVILVTHDARLAGWADRVVFLRDGRIVDQTGPRSGPEVLLREPARR